MKRWNTYLIVAIACVGLILIGLSFRSRQLAIRTADSYLGNQRSEFCFQHARFTLHPDIIGGSLRRRILCWQVSYEKIAVFDVHAIILVSVDGRVLYPPKRDDSAR